MQTYNYCNNNAVIRVVQKVNEFRYAVRKLILVYRVNICEYDRSTMKGYSSVKRTYTVYGIIQKVRFYKIVGYDVTELEECG